MCPYTIIRDVLQGLRKGLVKVKFQNGVQNPGLLLWAVQMAVPLGNEKMRQIHVREGSEVWEGVVRCLKEPTLRVCPVHVYTIYVTQS